MGMGDQHVADLLALVDRTIAADLDVLPDDRDGLEEHRGEVLQGLWGDRALQHFRSARDLAPQAERF